MSARVLLTNPIHPHYQALLAEKVDVVLAENPSPQTILRLARDCDAMIVRAHLPEDVFDHAPSMKYVVRHGVGLDMIPMEQATARGIAVANMPGGNTVAVTEYALAAIFHIRRGLATIDRTLREKGWHAAKPMSNDCIELAGSTCGIIGVGSIGKRLAAALHALDVKVLGLTRRPQTMPSFVEAVDKQTLLERSDIVILACPHNAQTHHLINADAIAAMKPGAAIVNVARGPVVDTAALVQALNSGQVGAAVLDVHESAMLTGEEPIFGCPNTLLTPHLAGLTATSLENLSRGSVETVLALLAGERPDNVVNPEVFDASS
ncbi:NAD(P)-dependent oxidoreductase [Orrella marina]|uniref:Hydroxyacid dehydrogenase n=1 Tax=Orrella marina TaxID=2163011 RepID=A0A2R4XLY6_9BURK|nr:NAD(P)-dependent oxidoreductase [Orrella marina]AWB34805.1 hydroxyacid dehydrogenase [Orrella marina]